MKKFTVTKILVLGFVFILSGCLVRTYPLTRERVDQSLSAGNRGYLQGNLPALSDAPRKETRTTQIVEIELGSPLKFEKGKRFNPEESVSEGQLESVSQGNNNFTNQEEPAVPAGNFEKYTVLKNDTLQKISVKFYNTTKKWVKIYNANKGILKTANSVYPGQTLNIPVENKEPLKEPKENLK